jgi:hypothetical protein
MARKILTIFVFKKFIRILHSLMIIIHKSDTVKIICSPATYPGTHKDAAGKYKYALLRL